MAKGSDTPEQESELMRTAIVRMHAAPSSFFTEEEREALESCEDPIVGGNLTAFLTKQRDGKSVDAPRTP